MAAVACKILHRWLAMRCSSAFCLRHSLFSCRAGYNLDLHTAYTPSQIVHAKESLYLNLNKYWLCKLLCNYRGELKLPLSVCNNMSTVYPAPFVHDRLGWVGRVPMGQECSLTYHLFVLKGRQLSDSAFCWSIIYII